MSSLALERVRAYLKFLSPSLGVIVVNHILIKRDFGNVQLMFRPLQIFYQRGRPIEIRPVEIERYRGAAGLEPKFNDWMRAIEPLPDEPAFHRSVLAYASDLLLLDSSLIAHGTTVFDGKIQAARAKHTTFQDLLSTLLHELMTAKIRVHRFEFS